MQNFETRLNEIQDAMRVLEFDIHEHIKNEGAEILSYASYFEKRFPILHSNINGIREGIKSIEEAE